MTFYLTSGIWKAAEKAKDIKFAPQNDAEKMLADFLEKGGVNGLVASYINKAVLQAAIDASKILKPLSEMSNLDGLSDEAQLAINRERKVSVELTAWADSGNLSLQLEAAMASSTIRAQSSKEAARRRQARFRAKKKAAAE